MDAGSSAAASLSDELRQFDLRAGTEMADDFGGAQTAEFAANGQRQTPRQPVEKTARVKVAGAGCVDDALDRYRRNAVLGSRNQDHATRGAARQGRDCNMPAYRRGGPFEIVRLVERADLGLVGEKDVDMAVDEIAKGRPMTPDAERVGKA